VKLARSLKIVSSLYPDHHSSNSVSYLPDDEERRHGVSFPISGPLFDPIAGKLVVGQDLNLRPPSSRKCRAARIERPRRAFKVLDIASFICCYCAKPALAAESPHSVASCTLVPDSFSKLSFGHQKLNCLGGLVELPSKFGLVDVVIRNAPSSILLQPAEEITRIFCRFGSRPNLH